MSKLQILLTEKGIKQVWLAKKIGKSPAQVNRWIKGKRTPNYENMLKIARALNMSVEEIFFNDYVGVSANKNISQSDIKNDNTKTPI